MPYATVEDLQNRFEGTIPDALGTVLGNKIAQAERIIRAVLERESGFATIDAAIEAGKTTPDDVEDVVCSMVLRTVRNAAGVTSQTAGPFSQTLDAAVASGKLWLTREDRLQLGLRRRRSGSAAMVDDNLPRVLTPPPCRPPWRPPGCW